MGSPPRVREKQSEYYRMREQAGITPACAGKTGFRRFESVTGWDHPRVCGKNYDNSLDTTWKTGSPPRVREKRKYYDGCCSYFGITPACAGKTLKDPNEIKTFLSS